VDEGMRERERLNDVENDLGMIGSWGIVEYCCKRSTLTMDFSKVEEYLLQRRE